MNDNWRYKRLRKYEWVKTYYKAGQLIFLRSKDTLTEKTKTKNKFGLKVLRLVGSC